MFSIQVGNPIVFVKPDVTCEDLRDAIEEIFPMETEDALLFWSGIPILLSYKYDICILIDDILPMLEILLSNLSGEYSICFPSNTFRVDWALQWQNGLLIIDSTWYQLKADKEQLNERPVLIIDFSTFLAEWKPFLQKIISSLELSQVKIKDHKAFKRLCQIESDIQGKASLINEHPLSEEQVNQMLNQLMNPNFDSKILTRTGRFSYLLNSDAYIDPANGPYEQTQQIDYYDEGQIIDKEWAEGFSEEMAIDTRQYEPPEKGYYDENP